MTSARDQFIAGYRRWVFDESVYWHLGDRKFYSYKGLRWFISPILTDGGLPEFGPFPAPNYLDGDLELRKKYDLMAALGDDVRSKHPEYERILYSPSTNTFLSAVDLRSSNGSPKPDDCESQWEDEVDDCARRYAGGRIDADEYDDCRKRAAARRDLCRRQER